MQLNSTRFTAISAGMITALISISAFIRIPNPFLPFSLQMLVIFLIPLVFGARTSFYGVLLYIVLGLIGLPIFVSGGGISYVLKPSFGYLIGYLIAVIPAGIIAKKYNNIFGYILSGVVSIIIIYAFGITYLYIAINFIQSKAMDFITAVKVGGIIFIIPDLIKLTVAIFIAPLLKRALQHIDK